MSYLALKHIHVTAVIISIAGFLLRYGLSLVGDGWRRHAILRIGPHIVDTILLVSAIALSVVSRQYPLVHDWLTMKVVALPVYIVAGSIALRPGRSERTRALALIVALLAFAHIVGAAIYKTTWGWL